MGLEGFQGWGVGEVGNIYISFTLACSNLSAYNSCSSLFICMPFQSTSISMHWQVEWPIFLRQITDTHRYINNPFWKTNKFKGTKTPSRPNTFQGQTIFKVKQSSIKVKQSSRSNHKHRPWTNCGEQTVENEESGSDEHPISARHSKLCAWI